MSAMLSGADSDAALRYGFTRRKTMRRTMLVSRKIHTR